MDDRKSTNEQFRAIERWENEGGSISRAVSITPSRQMEIARNEEPAPQEVIVPRKKQPWEKVKLWPRWSLAS